MDGVKVNRTNLNMSEPAMVKWQYKMVKMQSDTVPNIEHSLDELGWEGWELCGIDYGCFILKRPIPDTE
jgi:hypothetical protein